MSKPTVILSRKGFDSSAGGKANWIIDNKKLVPVPIPEADTGIYYSDLRVPTTDKTFREVMRDLSINQYSEAHPDPFISELYRCEKTINWEYSLGQCGTSMSHLLNNGVGEGSIFLFFGWFNKIEYLDSKWSYTQLDEYLKDGVHMIYGYMLVDKVIDPDVLKYKWLANHPHNTLKEHITQYPQPNKLFLAKEAGVFDFDEELILTEKYKSKSNWKLDDSLSEVKFTHLKTQRPPYVKANFRGQELIAIEGKEKAMEWARNIILKHKKNVRITD